MNEQRNSFRPPEPPPGGPQGRAFWLAIVGAGLLAVGATAVYQSTQTASLTRQLASSKQDVAALRAQLDQANSTEQATLNSLRDQIQQEQDNANANLANAQSIAAQRADKMASRLARAQEEENKRLKEELGKVKDSATEASTKLDGFSSQVGSVRTDVDSTRTDLEQTKAELQHARGDLGEMSGLIATNSKQIQTLRDLGDRNIFEFAITKKSGMQKLGDVQVRLEKADPRHNRFTVELLADDKHVEKKDRTINEPVQFYTSKATQPYELVVNQVDKDKVVGYLSTPKVTSARNSPPLTAQ